MRHAAYDDGTGTLTLGYGHTRDVLPGQECDFHMAEQWLADDLAEAEMGVERLVVVPMSEGMRDALASFVFNLGAGALGRSRLLQVVNTGQHFTAAKCFLNWTMAGGKPLRGLMRRRLAEAALYCADPWPT